jgi:diguanylate cyclase (GGDEF)-like protein/PAS domain S-box-containing protein
MMKAIHQKHPIVVWLVLVVGSIFLAELLIMLLVASLGLDENAGRTSILDAVLLTGFVGPLLYFFSVRPTQRLVEAQAEALQRVHLASIVFDHAEDGIVITDARGTIQQVNRAFTRITGYSADEVVGQNPRVLKSGRHDAEFYRDLWSEVMRSGHWSGEVWNRAKDGSVYPETLSITAIRNEAGVVTNFAGIASLGFHDRLTGLPNRHLLVDRVTQAILDAERNQEGLAVVFIDLDGFKAINDSCGHDAGDEVLQSAAAILRSTIRKNDIAARLGGDEFVLVLRGVKAVTDVTTVLDKLLPQWPTPSARFAPPGPVTFSVGFSLYPADGKAVDELLRHADEAMYVAKQRGKNTWVQFTSTMSPTRAPQATAGLVRDASTTASRS